MLTPYEEISRTLARCKPEYKDILLARLIKGEKVDITRDEHMFYQINADRVSMDEFVNRDRYKAAAKQVKITKDGMYDKKFGRSKGRKLRMIGEIPAEVYFQRKEFSPLLPKEERDRNIRKFLKQFPAFKTTDENL